MKNITIKLVIVIAALVAADRIAGDALEWLYFSQKGEDYRYATKAIDEQEAELLILGSSRARNHYDATMIGDAVGMTAYNCGRSGHFMIYQSAQLDMILDRYTPKVVMLDVTPYDLEGNGGEGEYDILGSLLPYDSHASYGQVLRKRSWYEPAKALSKTYRYNSKMLKMLNNTGTADNGGFHEDGHQPVEGSLCGQDTIMQDAGNADGRISPNMLGEMEHIVTVCRERGIRLVMATSPYYARYAKTATIAATENVCKANGIPYRSWLNAKEFENAGLFFTTDHLNADGAQLFSKDVAEWLREIILEQE